jgi:hypothetical protein
MIPPKIVIEEERYPSKRKSLINWVADGMI